MALAVHSLLHQNLTPTHEDICQLTHHNTLSSNPKMPASSQTHKETTNDELQVQLLETSFSLLQMNNSDDIEWYVSFKIILL